MRKATTRPAATPEPRPPEPGHFVAIGASAGGLEAIEAFFTHMPAQSGLAFIVIQHLSPDYKSLMVELLSKRTAMPVQRAEDGMLVRPDTVYLIPPKKNLSIHHGKLLLSDQDHSRGLNLPIDVFMRALAEDQGERAVGIVLSGTGSDGMRGVRAIKENGGMLMVQDEESAKFDGMPRAAQSTGLADFVLPPEQMPAQLLAFARHPRVAKPEPSEVLLSEEDRISHLFSILRERCKVDFTFYKPSTVSRRIERRMTVNQVPGLKEYVAFLQHHPAEAISLFKELLIGVTSFFRDPEVWEQVVRGPLRELLLAADNREIRFWVAACSTGEEAYTLAILVRECLDELGLQREVKIFATDIDQDAIHYAAAGSYPESIAADVSARLLAKYFSRREDNFVIARSVREMVVFAKHNLIKDPPFTKISLVSCRNVLIYLQPVLQAKVLDGFHFSLTGDGLMLLGTSETTGELSESWETLDGKGRLYRPKGGFRTHPGLDHGAPATDTRARDLHGRATALRRSLRQPDEERLLERFVAALAPEFVPLALIVNEQLELLHVVGDTEGYFKLPSGPQNNDISRLAVKELSIPLITGIQKTLREGKELRFRNLRLPHRGGTRVVELRIRPLPAKKHQEPLVAVFLGELRRPEPAAGGAAAPAYDLAREVEDRIRDLEQDLQFTRENLQATIEELETSNEELQATNEELLASNEELQSTNEELQSTNEELYTVNTELQSKLIELTMLHNDVENLLSASRVGTILVDEDLEVRRFAPAAGIGFRLVDGDLGRPLGHIPHLLADCDPAELVRAAQASGQPSETEARTRSGQWILVRTSPYLVGPGAASGTVVSLVDITGRKRMEEDLRASEANYRQLYDQLAQGRPGQAGDWSARVRLPWQEAYALGHPLIDRQHRELLDFSNRLLERFEAGDPAEAGLALEALLGHVDRHFQDEEAILAQVRYPELPAHQAAHGQLLATARLLRRDFLAGSLSQRPLLDYLANQVLKEHMLGADEAYRPWLPGAPADAPARP